jgi:bifunctional DNA primase/polymerase-like protein
MTIENAFFDGGSSPPAASHSGLTPHDNAAEPLPGVDFRTLAVEHIARGFVVSATKPESKEGFHGWNRYNLLISADGVDRFLKKYPQCSNSNVAVCGSCGFHTFPNGEEQGNLLILDIDRAGVIEQILAENKRIVRKMPTTYVVASRPTTNPAKQHWYFRHTFASIAAFKKLGRGVAKEISAIRDVTAPKDERGLYPNRYDLKGSGKGGFVVGAGGLHHNGEQYTKLNDNPVVDLPDWLLNWLIKDVLKYRIAVAEAKQIALAHAANVNALSPKRRATLQQRNDPDGFIISKENTYGFLRAKAQFLATKGGLPVEVIRQSLLSLAPIRCHDGKAFVESEAGQKAIDHILKYVKVDSSEAWLHYEYDEHFIEPKPIVWTSDSKPLAVQNSRTARLLQIAQDFDPIVSTVEMYKAFGFPPRPTPAQRKLAERVMNKAGYKADAKVGMDNSRSWRQGGTV